jgi:hypothetical protein
MTSARPHGSGNSCRSRFHPPPGYTAHTSFVRRWKAPMFWKTGPPTRSFSSPSPTRCGGPLHGDTNSQSPAPVDGLNRRPRVGDAPRRSPPAPSAPARSSPKAHRRQPPFRPTRRPPRTPRRRADRRSGCIAQQPSTWLSRGSMDGQRTRRTGPTRAPRARAPSSSRALHRSISMSSSPSRRLSVIVPVLPPAPARPENGTTAIVAPRRSSSSHTALRAPQARRAQGTGEQHVGGQPHDRTACGTARPAAPCTSGTHALASHARCGGSAPRWSASETHTDVLGSERRAPPSSAGTTHPAIRGGRSRPISRHRASPVVTVLVTVSLARADFRWLAVARPAVAAKHKLPATGAVCPVCLAMTYGSDGTRTRDLRRDRPAL